MSRRTPGNTAARHGNRRTGFQGGDLVTDYPGRADVVDDRREVNRLEDAEPLKQPAKQTQQQTAHLVQRQTAYHVAARMCITWGASFLYTTGSPPAWLEALPKADVRPMERELLRQVHRPLTPCERGLARSRCGAIAAADGRAVFASDGLFGAFRERRGLKMRVAHRVFQEQAAVADWLNLVKHQELRRQAAQWRQKHR